MHVNLLNAEMVVEFIKPKHCSSTETQCMWDELGATVYFPYCGVEHLGIIMDRLSKDP